MKVSKYKKETKDMVWAVRIPKDVQDMVKKLVKDDYNVADIARDAWMEFYKKVYGGK